MAVVTPEQGFYAGALLVIGVLMIHLHVTLWRGQAELRREIDEYERKYRLK